MNRDRSTLALVCAMLWLIASASAGVLGIWVAMGGVAMLLGIAVVALDPAAQREALRPTRTRVLAGAAAGVAMAAATWLLYAPLARAFPFVASDTARLHAAFREAPVLVASLALVPVILGEELVWRNVVQPALVQRAGLFAGIALASIAYALAHVPLGSPVLVFVALACGLSWGALRAASGSIVPSFVAHLLWDVVVLLWLPLGARSR